MKSIRFKLWSGMMALSIVVLILLWLFQIVFLENFYTEMHISDVKKAALSAVKTISEDNDPDYENALEPFSYKYNVDIELIGTDGNAVFRTATMGPGGMPMMNGIREKVYQKTLEGNEAELSFTHPRLGNKFMMIGLRVELSGATPAVMLLNLPLAPVGDTVSILKRQFLYITVLLLAAALLISYLISKDFTRPILEIEKATEVMADGDFSARIKLKQRDEIGKLAGSINHLGEQLSKIEQLRKDLISNISHELRTPLSLIRGYAETIRDVTGEFREKREKQIQIIIEETERLGGIVDDVLNLSQLQSGYAVLSIGSFSIKELLNAVVKRYEVLSEKTRIELLSRYDEDRVLEADKARIEQVLYNLINNAFNHTEAGGSILVNARVLSNAVRFEVTDTGSGIAEEDIPHIWERFYKADKTVNKKAGTGLGLAIVKGVLDAHHASYGVESRKGTGTTIWFELKT